MNNKSFAQTQRAVQSHELIACLHPRLVRWFHETFAAFTHAQLLCVPAVLDRHSILLTSPTGSGKTLADFLGVFDFLLRRSTIGMRSTGCNAFTSRRCRRLLTISRKTRAR
jgi:Lhr-like helicase